MLKIPMARMAFCIPAPTVSCSKIAMTRAGKAKIKSFMRIMTWLNQFARAEAISPSGTPMPAPSITEPPATRRDAIAPRMVRPSRSRPNWSVPNQCSSEGERSFSETRMIVGSGIHGITDRPAIMTIRTMITAPIQNPLWRNSDCCMFNASTADR